MPGIPRSASDLIPLLTQAAAAITLEVNWPATGPTPTDVINLRNDLQNKLTTADATSDLLRIQRQAVRESTRLAYAMARQVDLITDMLYGPTGAQKTAFGVEPARLPAAGGVPPKVVITNIQDGTLPGSIFLDFEPVEGAIYEAEWFTDAALVAPVGHKTATASEVIIDGLAKGTQYWIRIRAIRAGKPGPWSDPATRVANV